MHRVLLILDIHRRIWVTKKVGPYNFFEPTPKFRRLGPDESIPLYATTHPTMINPGCTTLPPPMPGGLHPRCLDLDYEGDELCEKRKAEIAAYNDPDYPRVNITCHNANYKFWNDNSKLTGVSPIRFTGDFAVKCTDRYPTNKKAAHKVCPEWQGKFKCSDRKFNTPWKAVNDDGEEERYFPKSFCRPCKKLKPDQKLPFNDGFTLFKRNAHGSFMILAFLFLLPVSLLISRFFKETLHNREIKGFRLWLMARKYICTFFDDFNFRVAHEFSMIFQAHITIAVASIILSYAAYTMPAFFKLDAHIYLGYGGTFCLVFGFLTGWPRPKDPPKLHCIYYLHALSGYAAWGLGSKPISLYLHIYKKVSNMLLRR